MAFPLCPHSVYALGGKEAAASLLLPTTGQAMNGELGKTKTKMMGAIEIASVTTIAILGIFIGIYLSKFIRESQLKKGFGWFVLIMAVFILTKELFF